jgi:hypothetical protein
MSRPRRRPTLPVPSEVALAPGDKVVLTPRNLPAKPFIFGEVGSPPYWAYIQNTREDRRGLRHPLRRAVLVRYTVHAVYRGGACIAKVREPRRAGMWDRVIPEPPEHLEDGFGTPQERRARLDERPYRVFLDAGWSPDGVGIEGSWTYNKLDVHARVWYAGGESKWCFALLVAGAYTQRPGFRSDAKALATAHTHIRSRPRTEEGPS